MTVIVRAPLVHQCPHKPELDVGRIEMQFVDEAPELYELSQYLQSFVSVAETHESITRKIAEDYFDANVRTFWHTAGCEVEVVA